MLEISQTIWLLLETKAQQKKLVTKDSWFRLNNTDFMFPSTVLFLVWERIFIPHFGGVDSEHFLAIVAKG